MSTVLRALRRLTATLVVGVAFACTSPTLPLPPPSAPDFGPSTEAGKVHLSSVHGAESNAIIVIYNRNPAVALDKRVSGAQADPSGSWDADVLATSGDYLDITQEFGSTRSPPNTIKVP
jgi:hypothetical protein